MNRLNLTIHVVHRTIIMAIHALSRDEIMAFSRQNAVLHYQLLTHAESLEATAGMTIDILVILYTISH